MRSIARGIAILATLSATTAAPIESGSTSYDLHTMYQYPENTTWLENLAIRRNGNILLTSIGAPGGLHELDPHQPGMTPRLVHSFPGLNSTTGIVETSPDEFYVAVSNASIKTLTAQPGTNYIYRVKYSSASKPPTVEKVSHLPNAGIINGLTALSDCLLLAADSAAGTIYSVDTENGASKLVFANNSYMSSRPYEPVGVDGLKIRNGDLYFTNAVQSLLAKVPINSDGTAAGEVTPVATPPPGGQYDDFVFDSRGTIFAANGIGNTVQRIDSNGKSEIIAGSLNSTDVAQPTATAFGRTLLDNHVLYVTTGGASGKPVTVNGRPVSVGAQLLALVPTGRDCDLW